MSKRLGTSVQVCMLAHVDIGMVDVVIRLDDLA